MTTKIVHLITDLDTGGAETMLLKLLSRMDGRRFANVVVSMTADGTLAEQFKELGVPVYSLGMQRGRPSLRGSWRLWRILRREKPAVLQTWLYHADLLGLVVGKLARVRAIVWNVRCADLDLSHYARLTRLVVWWLARLSRWPTAAVINAEAGRQFHETLGYRPRRWQVIPNGFDLARFRPDPLARVSVHQELGLPLDAFLIGLVARYDPAKDHATFLRAAAILAKAQPRVYFVLVGSQVDADNAFLMGLVRELGLEGRAKLLGRRSDIARLTAAFDVATLSSVSEGFPNVIGEAMACCVPCVVTDVGDAAQVVGDTGLVVPPRDPSALAAAWGDLLAMREDQRRALGTAARARVARHFSLEVVTAQYETLYNELIGS